jgi:DNA-binding response OmpR family regulator
MPEEHRRQILVVDDDVLMAKMLKARLELAGFDVHLEHTGAGALQYASIHKPGLVILDLRLPDIHGYQVCALLRKLFHRDCMPVVMLTGMEQPVDQLRGYAHGADAYLTKPCEADELLGTISELFG